MVPMKNRTSGNLALFGSSHAPNPREPGGAFAPTVG
jgi:hypothetical protein